jgi:hypothetical protein
MPSPPRSHTPPLDELASIDGDTNGDAGTERRQEGHVQDEEPTPLPLPRALRRQPSTTMPGALFPRSPSMVPESAAAVGRHVHFPNQPTYFDYEVPIPGPSSSPERPRPPNSIPRGSRSRAGSVGETSGRRAQEDGVGAGDAVSPGPSWKEKGKQRASAEDAVLKSEASSPPRPIGTGRSRGHAIDAGPELISADTSGEIRVRGKERELSAVREERRAREQWWEAEVETTVIREEKAEYEEKIKRLEEEVQRLTAEVRDFLPYTMFHSCSLRAKFFQFTFKVGKAVCALNNIRRLLVFASHAPASASTATATAYAPCPAPYIDYTRNLAGVFCQRPCASATCWHSSRSPHQFIVHGEACRTAHYRRPCGQNGGVPQGDEKRATAEGCQCASRHGSTAPTYGLRR